MRHCASDGRGPREVWLDGFLLEYVNYCDDEAAVALVTHHPFQIQGDEVVSVIVRGDVMVVRSIENDYQV